MNPEALLALFDRPIAFQRPLVDVTGSVTAALMLSQALYWSARTPDPERWFFKDQPEWTEETGLTRYEQEGARKSLRSIGVWEEKRRGVPARLYYRVRLLELYDLVWNTVEQSRLRKNPNLDCGKPTNKNVVLPLTISESTEETTDREKGSNSVNRITGTETAPGGFQFPPGFHRLPSAAPAAKTNGAHSSPSPARKSSPAGRQRGAAAGSSEEGGKGFTLFGEIDEYHETPAPTATAAWTAARAEIYAILRKEFPDIGCKPAPARDRNIKRFWRENGKTVQSVRTLCEKVNASDFLMKRGGHTGIVRLDFNWMFDPEKSGKIMADDYSNERMAFALDGAAGPMVEVMISGVGKKKVPASEIGDGKKYFALGTDKITGLPKVAVSR